MIEKTDETKNIFFVCVSLVRRLFDNISQLAGIMTDEQPSLKGCKFVW